ncbi:flagellar hook protein FlgE [Clostridium botulinum D/C]|uniref:flagellar hook protein FlgE n=1 Tax=Clostridium botulinum TaxID=1491 RepID=UPI001E541698|nr:flagellar hook-basal body complex protein [Clostridium botulinum]MCD3350248.1 flagellar hook protein FlgE [Clostridium botulinum D/C]MCD3359186.1 flagellar hook protein FlgE [Clostridium botulinum D/C]MCD3361770.1 flagellar hook protein FlgE [Clostridium botulinum D/C]MCD3364773.1 flagellar hook protein FlgE [Clostridium botulinum D/C]
MLRSMYAGISGMKVNQTKLDVTGNNIANVSTTGFKSSRVRFKDMLSQNMGEAVGPGRNQGGVNGKQVGLGVQVAGIDTVMSQGMMQPTSRNLDVAMDGSGYFIVAKGALPENNAGGISVSESDHTMSGGAFQVNYTRDGSFTLDHQGNLLTSDGYRVMGYAINEKMDKEGSKLGKTSVDYGSGTMNFVDADGEFGLKASSTLIPLRIPDSIHLSATSNNSKQMKIVSGDKLLFDNDDAKEGIQGFPEVKLDATFKGKGNVKVEVKYDTKDNKGTDKGWIIFLNGKKTFLEANSAEIDDTTIDGVDIALLSASEKKDIKELLNGSKITVTEPTPNATNIDTDDKKAKYKWEFTLQPECDKKLRSFSIEKDGLVKGILDDGTVTALGQIATASFKNQEGLKKEGKNLFSNTANSGVPTVRSGIGGPKDLDNGDGYGEMLQGMLEMSNVDLAEQFTDMIVTTRAFQASGKMISTGDEILQDIINLKR